MKNLTLMYLFRVFVVGLVFTYILCNIADRIVIGFLILGLMFLGAYYWKYLKEIFKKNSWYYFIIILSMVLAIFVYIKNIRKEIRIEGSRVIQVLVIRDTILDSEVNTTLGKVVGDSDMKNKLILISSDMLEEFKIGQVLEINAKIEKNKYLANAFDMLFFGRVDYQASFPEIVVSRNVSGGYFFRMVSWTRNLVDNRIKSIFGLKNHSLFSMWILGKTKASDRELNNIFKALGVSHILVVSGTHLSILFNIICYLLLFLPIGYLLSMVLASVFLVAFLFLSGFSSSILRATVFWIVVSVGKINGRIVNYTNVLLLSLLGFLILNPRVLVFDIGFHLSFLSIVALVYVTPMLNDYFKSRNKIVDNCLVIFKSSLAVTIVLLPYLVYIFKDFNLMSIGFNIFLIPFSGVILGAVFLVVLVGLVALPLARVLGLFVNYLGDIFVWSLRICDYLSMRSKLILFNSIFFVIVYYIVLIVLVIDYYIKHRELTMNI